MAPNAAGLTWLGAWIQAKPSRAHQGSLEVWRDYILAGLQENPDGYFTKISKTLSYMLRHGAEEQGLVLNRDGSVLVKTLLCHPKFKHYSADDIEITVRTNAKQRFGMDVEDGNLVVYCRQGHSNRLGLDPFSVRGMVALAPADVPAIAVHGTFKANLASIRTRGLMASERPIHFAMAGGQSGVRGDSDVHLHVAVQQAAFDGIPFFKSENGVLLTNGRDGILPSKYIVGGTSFSGACLFGEIPNQSSKGFQQSAANSNGAHTPAPEAVIEQPKAIVRRWGKAAKDHAEPIARVVSANTDALPDHLLPAHFPASDEVKLQTTSPALHGVLHSDSNPCDGPVLPRNIELAKSVITVLRYKMQDKGLSLDVDGFVTLRELSQLRRFTDASEEDIWNEVNADKARFDVKVLDGCRMIRPTYKHSRAMATSHKRSRCH